MIMGIRESSAATVTHRFLTVTTHTQSGAKQQARQVTAVGVRGVTHSLLNLERIETYIDGMEIFAQEPLFWWH